MRCTALAAWSASALLALASPARAASAADNPVNEQP